mgnify:CR=1 FL=1
MDYSSMSPRDVRQLIREGKITCNTSGMCAGYAQANLCVLPKDLAYDFLLFAQRNPRPCPILEVSDVGSRFLKKIAPGADIANDIPKYRVYENGVMTGEYTSVEHLWRDDFVSFLIGCSFSFESELIAQMCRLGISKRAGMFRCILRISSASPPEFSTENGSQHAPSAL